MSEAKRKRLNIDDPIDKKQREEYIHNLIENKSNSIKSIFEEGGLKSEPVKYFPGESIDFIKDNMKGTLTIVWVICDQVEILEPLYIIDIFIPVLWSTERHNLKAKAFEKDIYNNSNYTFDKWYKSH